MSDRVEATQSPTVRIRPATHQALREIASSSGMAMQSVVEAAIELYRRHLFLEQVNASFGALRERDEEWRQDREEREAWDATQSDGLDGE